MNNEADKLAAWHHQIRGEWSSRGHSEMIPGQQVQIYFDSEQTENNIKTGTERHLRGHMMECYIDNKLQILFKVLKTIDWLAIARLNIFLTIHKRATQSNFFLTNGNLPHCKQLCFTISRLFVYYARKWWRHINMY